MYSKIASFVSTDSTTSMNLSSRYFISGLFFFVLLLVACILVSLGLNDGVFVYPLDDTYIHMTITRNIAMDGTWGMEPGVFASSSSSIFYTLLLSLVFYITGSNLFAPLVLNIIPALLVIFYFYKKSRAHGIHPHYFAFILFLLIVGVSMIPVTMSGMEHTWQIWFGLMLIYESARHMESRTRQFPWLLLLLSCLTVMVRYEGIFLVGIIAFFMLLRGQIVHAILLVCAGALPVVAFGIYSIAQGGYFLPNTLLLKGQTPELGMRGLYLFSVNWMIKLIEDPHMLLIFGVLVALFVLSMYRVADKWKLENIMIWILIPLIIAHLTFAKTGWFYRYEAYLMAFSFFAFMLIGKNVYPRVKALLQELLPIKVTTLLILLSLPLLFRGIYIIRNTPIAMNNIYGQQYQMASFVKSYNPESRAIANDIGAISFYNQIHLLDLFGLANREVLDMKRQGTFTKENIQALAGREQMEYAIIYDYPDRIPASWEKIGEWTISNNVVCENATVALYVIDKEKKAELAEAFRKHSSALPEDVSYKFNE